MRWEDLELNFAVYPQHLAKIYTKKTSKYYSLNVRGDKEEWVILMVTSIKLVHETLRIHSKNNKDEYMRMFFLTKYNVFNRYDFKL